MERFLSAFVSEAQAGGQSLLVNIKIAVLPIAKVFTMCFLGFILASKYVNILPASGRRLLNRVCHLTPSNSYTRTNSVMFSRYSASEKKF